MENNELELNEEEVSIVTFTDENGEECHFEYLDCVEYEGKEYIVLTPAEEDAAEIIILEIQPVDEENENYVSVEDEKILDTVYRIFQDRFKDIYTFAD